MFWFIGGVSIGALRTKGLLRHSIWRWKESDMAKVLVACEESQEVCKAFRELGHEAYSCDIQDCSGGHPEWHIMGDVLPVLNGNCQFFTRGGSGNSYKGIGI